MRLINADELKKLYENAEGLNVPTEVILANIDDMPTAYDMDKVLEEIKELGSTDVMKDCGEDFIHMRSVLEIVKGEKS